MGQCATAAELNPHSLPHGSSNLDDLPLNGIFRPFSRIRSLGQFQVLADRQLAGIFNDKAIEEDDLIVIRE